MVGVCLSVMHTLWLIARYGVGMLLLAGIAHCVLWVWLKRAFPGHAVRFRRWWIGGLVLLTSTVLVRLASYFFTFDGAAWLIGSIMLWQLTAGTAALFIALSYGSAWTWNRLRSVWKRASLTREPARPERRRLLEGATGMALLGGTGVAFGRGFVSTRFDIEVVKVVIRVPRLAPELNGFTIVQLSDVHVGAYFDSHDLAPAIKLARGLKPDLYVVTGDIVDLNPGFVPAAGRALASLTAPHGVIAVLGNHDYYTGATEVLTGLRAAGVQVLVNESRRIEGNLVVAGLDDVVGKGREGGGNGPDVDAALRGVRREDVTVMLAHQPHLFDETAERVDVQLSGHTHGGQIRPGFSAADLVYPYVAGRYERAGATLWVNRGIGVGGAPTRIGVRPELTHIVLLAERNS